MTARSDVPRRQARAARRAAHRRPGAVLRPQRAPGDVVRLVAHRGSGHGRNDMTAPPENTLAAVRHGYAAGADAVEVDVWCTRDGIPVLHHDRTTDRTTDLAGADITELTLAELQRVSAGAWKARQWRGERVPTLADAAAEVPPGRALVVEIEQGPQAVDPILAALSGAGLADDQVVLISYNLDTAAQVRRSALQHRVFWILDTMPRWQLGGWAQGHRRGSEGRRHGYDEHANVPWILDTAIQRGLTGIDTLFAYPPDLPGHLARAPLDWMVWTVNDPRAIEECLADGAWALTTDNTDDVRRWLGDAGLSTAVAAGQRF